MKCPRCGTEVNDGQKFCTECGAQMEGPVSEKKGLRPLYIVMIAVGSALFLMVIVTVVLVASYRTVKKTSEEIVESVTKDLHVDMPDNVDIDLDELNKAIKDLENLDLTGELEKNAGTDATPADDDNNDTDGEQTHYSYTDVTRAGNDITVRPNGGLNGKTVIANGKDLEGFLDYVDSFVLEKGRSIDRDLFYDIFAIMLVDESMLSEFEGIEKNMVMALTMANNFNDSGVKIEYCELDANKADDYRYHVKAFGTDDVWIVNYGNRTIYFNDGATEYTSDMFRTENLAVWAVAIEQYYK